MSIEIRPVQAEPYYELEAYSTVNNAGITDLEKSIHEFKEKQAQAFQTEG